MLSSCCFQKKHHHVPPKLGGNDVIHQNGSTRKKSSDKRSRICNNQSPATDCAPQRKTNAKVHPRHSHGAFQLSLSRDLSLLYYAATNDNMVDHRATRQDWIRRRKNCRCVEYFVTIFIATRVRKPACCYHNCVSKLRAVMILRTRRYDSGNAVMTT